MANSTALNYKDVAAFITDNADAAPEIWRRKFEAASAVKDFFGPLEGAEGSGKPIIRKDDFSKGQGEKVHIRNYSALRGLGVLGDRLLRGSEEKVKTGGWSFLVDMVRHGTAITKRVGAKLGIGSEMDTIARNVLAEWWGWRKQSDAMMSLIHQSNARNFLYGNSRANREALKSDDVLSTSDIVNAAQLIKDVGGAPCYVTNDPKTNSEVWGYLTVFPSAAGTSLRNSSTYLQAAREAGIRGPQNPLYTGKYVPWDGNVLYDVNFFDHDADGPIGSPLTPRMLLGKAIAGDETNPAYITGGGSNNTAGTGTQPYSCFFSNYAWEFNTDSTGKLAADTTDRYCLIINRTGANAGKVGFYNFQTNNGTKLTILKGLASAASGIWYTKVGNVTWDTGAFEGMCSNVHPSGSLVIETNSYGVPFCRIPVLGADSLARGYGNPAMSREEEKEDYGMQVGYAVQGVYGQAPCQRRDGVFPNFAILECALALQGIDLPNVT